MRHHRRYLTAALLSVFLTATALCFDLNSDTAVIFDYPGGTASLAKQPFGQPLHEEAKYKFLVELMSFLKGTIGLGAEKFEIEITGPLPSIAHGGNVDFYLTGAANGYRDILYRYAGSANYKRAAVSVKQMEISDMAKAPAKTAVAIGFSSDFRVVKGQRVNVTLISGVVQLEVDGEAMQSGSGTDSIKVKVRDTGREFVGRIAGPMEVHVVL